MVEKDGEIHRIQSDGRDEHFFIVVIAKHLDLFANPFRQVLEFLFLERQLFPRDGASQRINAFWDIADREYANPVRR